MPFFEPLPEPPPELQLPTEQLWAPPLWDRPSEGTLPAVVGVGQLLARTDTVAVAVEHLRVYPNGFQIVVTTITSPRLPAELRVGGFARLSMIARGTAATAGDGPTPPPARPMLRHPGMQMGPRMGVRFSNGQRAAAGWMSPFEVPTDERGIPTEPVMMSGGGGGGMGQFRFEHWVFPLPTPGPFEIFAEWADAGIEERSITISGDEVRAAAQRAIVLWS